MPLSQARNGMELNMRFRPKAKQWKVRVNTTRPRYQLLFLASAKCHLNPLVENRTLRIVATVVALPFFMDSLKLVLFESSQHY